MVGKRTTQGRMVRKKKLLKKISDDLNNVEVNYCLIGNEYPVEIFLDSLESREQKRIVALIELFDEQKGKLFNKEKFKKLEDSDCGAIYVFKSGQIRIAGFWKSNYRFNLIYSFKKKQNEWPRIDIKQLHENCKIFKKQENEEGK